MDFVRYYTETGPAWGAGDLLLLGKRPPEHVGRHAATLAALRSEDAPVFGAIVVATPTVIDDAFRRRVRDGFAHFMREVVGATGDELIEQLFGVVQFVSVGTLEISSASRLVETAQTHSAIILTGASLYRDPDLRDTGNRDRGNEDDGRPTWPPHLHRLMASTVAAARRSNSYVVWESGQSAPSHEADRELLMSVDAVGVFSEINRLPDLIEPAVFGSWLQLAREGRVDRALADLSQVAGLSTAQRGQILVRILHAAGDVGQLRGVLQHLEPELDDVLPEVAVWMAQAAVAAGANDIAERLLRRAIPTLMTREALELALVEAARLGDADLTDAAERRLASLFPASGLLRHRRAQRRADSGDFEGAATIILEENSAESRELAAFWRIAAQHVVEGCLPHPTDFIASVVESLPDWRTEAMKLAVRLLLHDESYTAALAICLDASGSDHPITSEAAISVLNVVQAAWLRPDHGLSDDSISAALKEVVRSLARNPNNALLRVRLLRLLGPQALGTTAIAMLCRAIVEFASEPTPIDRTLPFTQRVTPCSADELRTLTARGVAWLAEHQPFVPGTIAFPQTQIPSTPDAALRGLEDLAIHIAKNIDEDGRASLALAIGLAAAIAPHTSAPNEDLVTTRVAGAAVVRNGWAQLGRDLAEQSLVLAGTRSNAGDHEGARLGWLGYAEILAHTGNLEEALIALACTLSIRNARRWDDIWFESIIVIRVFRELGLAPLARPLVGSMRRAIAELDLHDLEARADLIDVQLDFLELDRAERYEARNVGPLLERATDVLRRSLDIDDDVAPSAAFVASLLAIAERNEVEAPSNIRALLAQASERIEGPLRRLVAMVQKPAPSLEDLEEYVKQIERARYVEDIGYDLRTATLLARRLLGADGVQHPEAAIYAIELLAEQSITQPPTSEEGQNNTRVTESAAESLLGLVEIVSDGLDVVLLGTCSSQTGEFVVRVSAAGAVVNQPVAETREVFSPPALARWRDLYPYHYAETGDLNVFYTSTEGIGVSALPQRAVVIASTDLQGFPVNLLNVDDNLAGWDHRLASSPSLSWLIASRRNPFSGDGRIVGWIPSDIPEEGIPALSPLADDLMPTFDAHGGRLARGADVPEDLSGADLAIVAAHGGVGEGARYFRVVEDDVGGAMTPASFADHFKGTGIAVLFVCSSGRLDPHPRASAVVGLVKQLLDSGCRTVIAPPWPLSVAVPRVWLPAFIERWSAGMPAIDAAYEANMAARDRMGYNPGEALAMSVYGDPLTKRARND